MANTTARTAKHIHGTNPQFLIEKVIRARIYDSLYWKQECFALTSESVIDRAVPLDCIGGTFGLQKPTPFLCLVCKLLQLQPAKEIILEYLAYPQLKYLRAVAAMYARLTFSAYDVYATLEPMLNDYRKLRFRHMNGQYTLTYMDVFIDDLLTQERVCELILPRLTQRDVVEEIEGLPPRMSKLENALLSTGVGVERAAAGDQSDASDEEDSTRIHRTRLTRRIERAQHVRNQREQEKQRRSALKEIDREAEEKDGEGDVRMEYPSQEEDQSDEDNGRFVSRSPSRSSGASARGDDDDDHPGFRSRSPSRSPSRDSEADDGYRSRSVSCSPDRM